MTVGRGIIFATHKPNVSCFVRDLESRTKASTRTPHSRHPQPQNVKMGTKLWGFCQRAPDSLTPKPLHSPKNSLPKPLNPKTPQPSTLNP